MLGRILFIVNSADLVSLIRQQCLSPNLYADDTQIYGASGPSDVGALLQKVTGCLTAVADCMSANRLQLYPDKTEFMWLNSPRSQHRLPTSGPLIGSNVVSPSATVRDVGFFHPSRFGDEDSRATDSVPLLCHLTLVAKHSSLHIDVRLPFPCFGTRPQQIGLLQQSPDRLASHSHPVSPVSPKCRSKAHFQPETL